MSTNTTSVPTLASIKRLHALVEHHTFTIDGTLDYDRIRDALTVLCNAVADYPGDTEDWLYIGEGGEACLSDLIVAVYWHASHWHSDRDDASMALLFSAGRVFSPGMSGEPDIDNEDDSPEYYPYVRLDELARQAA